MAEKRRQSEVCYRSKYCYEHLCYIVSQGLRRPDFRLKAPKNRLSRVHFSISIDTEHNYSDNYNQRPVGSNC